MSIQSLGITKVTSPGTPVPVTSNQNDPTKRVPTQSIVFQALPGNVGIIYVGSNGLNKGTGLEQFAFIPKPTNSLTGPFPTATISIPEEAAGLNATDFYVDADNANDGVLVAITVG